MICDLVQHLVAHFMGLPWQVWVVGVVVSFGLASIHY